MFEKDKSLTDGIQGNMFQWTFDVFLHTTKHYKIIFCEGNATFPGRRNDVWEQNNGCSRINSPLLHFIFSWFNAFHLKSKIHHQMQCEKLYNLHRTASFKVVVFVFKIDKILTLRKMFAQNCALFENKKYTLHN